MSNDKADRRINRKKGKRGKRISGKSFRTGQTLYRLIFMLQSVFFLQTVWIYRRNLVYLYE